MERQVPPWDEVATLAAVLQFFFVVLLLRRSLAGQPRGSADTIAAASSTGQRSGGGGIGRFRRILALVRVGVALHRSFWIGQMQKMKEIERSVKSESSESH